MALSEGNCGQNHAFRVLSVNFFFALRLKAHLPVMAPFGTTTFCPKKRTRRTKVRRVESLFFAFDFEYAPRGGNYLQSWEKKFWSRGIVWDEGVSAGDGGWRGLEGCLTDRDRGPKG